MFFSLFGDPPLSTQTTIHTFGQVPYSLYPTPTQQSQPTTEKQPLVRATVCLGARQPRNNSSCSSTASTGALTSTSRFRRQLSDCKFGQRCSESVVLPCHSLYPSTPRNSLEGSDTACSYFTHSLTKSRLVDSILSAVINYYRAHLKHNYASPFATSLHHTSRLFPHLILSI